MYNKRKLVTLTFAVLFGNFSIIAFADNKPIEKYDFAVQQNDCKVKGTVTDENGEPLLGATIKVKNSKSGAVTNENGVFAIDVPVHSSLVVSYVGYSSKTITVTKSDQNFKVMLSPDSKSLNEVVVTALGIKREKKALGYAIGEVKGEELKKAKEINVINSLAGKIPGLVISQTAGGPSGSSRVIIRGNTELTGNNQPLYVVDGVPLDNSNFGSADRFGGYDLGDGISSINPDDVESVSVLKGPAASALYGSRASHGVILITTKKGKAAGNKRLGVEFNSTLTLEHQLTSYDNIQSTYGQGNDGRLTLTDDRNSSSSSWGPKYDSGFYLKYFDGQPRPFNYIKNNIDGFFRTGITATNSVVVNSAKDNNAIRLTYTNMTNSDILPNTGMSRNTFNIRASSKVLQKLDIDVKANYVREDVKNRPALSDYRTNVANNLITLAGNFDQSWLKNNYKKGNGEYYDWNNGDVWNINPYWILYEMENKSAKNQFSGSVLLKYTFNDHLYLQVTGGGDICNMDFQEYAPYTTPGNEIGYMQKSKFNNSSYNIESLLGYHNKSKDFEYGGSVGANIYHIDNKTQIVTAKNMQMRSVVALQSFLNKEISEGSYRKQINSLYGMANASYKNFIYLDATLRCDRSSTLPTDNNTYVYPSVSSSFIFSEFLADKKILSFGKLRASWAQVGSDTDPYQLGLTYTMDDKNYNNIPVGFITNGVIPNKDLKPTRTNSIELGFDLKFLNNRVGLDVTYYNQRSNNQIMSMKTSTSSGYFSQLINAGCIENKGLEIALNSRPIQLKDFSWDLGVNFAKNSNKVVELKDGINSIELASARWAGVSVCAKVGEQYGAIMGQDFMRNKDGQIIIDGSTGLPTFTSDMKVLGSAAWDWTGGVNTAITYKSLTLSAIFDIKVGADLFSMTARKLAMAGKLTETLAGRDAWYQSEEQRLAAGVSKNNWEATGGYVADGVVETKDADGNATYTKNTKAINPNDYWTYVGNKTAAPFIYDNSYVKVREITLSYTLPQKWITKWAEAVSVSFVARNPFILYKNVPNIDPDSNYNNSGGMGLEYGSLPSRRSYGLNVNIKF